jgi:RNA polymerase sigma-70 factor (ECF subfamily)
VRAPGRNFYYFLKMERHSDEELLELLRQKNEAGYREIFVSLYPMLTAFAYKFVKDESVAKDAVQNVFIKLFSEDRNDIQNLRSYLFTAVRNESINWIKKEQTLRRHEGQFFSDTVEMIDFQTAIEETEAEERIYRAIQNLPPECRRIFMMSRFEGMKNPTIAADLGLSVRTVETQVSKALRILRKSLFNLFLLG